MHITEVLQPATATISRIVSFTPVRTFQDAPQPRKRVSVCNISNVDTALASAWSQVARAVTGYHVGPLEDGGECILITTNTELDAAAANGRWLIWRDRACVLSRQAGVDNAPSEHASMQAALQSIAPLSATEQGSVTLIAEAMLLFEAQTDEVMEFAIAA